MSTLFFSTHRIRTLLVLGCLFFSILSTMPARPSMAQTNQTFDITLAEMGYSEQTLRGPVAKTRRGGPNY